MNNKQNLIVVEQLPVIKTYLEQLSKEIKKRVDKATKLVCDENNYKEIKEIRASLNKEFNEFEEQRKQVKNAIMEKYDEFEEIYKENVSNLYKQADSELRKKIDTATYEIVSRKREEIENFANEYFIANNIQDLVKFDDINLNINLSSSVKSLKDKVVEFCKHFNDDLECISSDEHREELLLEYKKNGFDYSKAVLTIKKRYEEIKAIKEREQNIKEKLEQEQKNEEIIDKIIEKQEELTIPKEVIEDEEILTVQFVVKGTKSQILELKKWLKERGMYD